VEEALASYTANAAETLRAEGIKQPWRMQRRNVSPRFTTSWDELLTVNIDKPLKRC
jgi:hypothetical protein